MLAITDLTALTYIAMRQVAVNGTFYMSANQLAEMIWRVRPGCLPKKKAAAETNHPITSGQGSLIAA